jgi:probable rRNA maturation factor
MNLTVTLNRYNVDKNFIEKVAKTAFSFFENKEGEVEVNFIGEAKIRQINKDYRDIDKITDVLSFKLNDKPLTGQIFICYNKAKEQANILDKGIDGELALLLIHGILHLYDYNHQKEKEAEKMEKQENLILKELGLER